MSSMLEHETLQYDAAGQPCSARYGDRYASRAGAPGQARHVFLGGNALPRRWSGRRQFVIVETGFGLGNNFLACWQAWRDDPQRPGQLHFVSVEKHPLRPADLAQLRSTGDSTDVTSIEKHPFFPEYLVQPGSADRARPANAGGASGCEDSALHELRAALVAQWPLPLTGLHRLIFESGHVLLTLALGDARALVPQLALGADAFFLDGFAPQRNPEMWEPSLLRALARLARRDATVATYSVAGAVREALAANGFAVQRRQGYGVKRQMLSGQFAPRWKMRRHEPPTSYAGERRAVIVGAGLAGCAVALALVRRGWQVSLLDRGAGPAGGASGLPAGLVYPLLSTDDNLASRLSRAAYCYAQRALADCAVHGSLAAPIFQPCGVFQQAPDDAGEEALRVRLRRQPWPHAFARYEDAATAEAHIGIRPRRSGIWFPGGAAVHGGRWCAAMIAQAQAAALSGGALNLHWNCEIERVQVDSMWWHAQESTGRIHAAPVLVLANAAGLGPLLPLAHLPVQPLTGELTLLKSPALQGMRAALGGDGYVIPPLLGTAATGATYVAVQRAAGAAPVAQATDSTTANLQRLQQLLAEIPAVDVQGSFRADRCVSPDRLPLVGHLCDESRVLGRPREYAGAHLADLPRQPGLYCLAALGSRGLTLAPLMGELLAAAITGEPAPVESILCQAIDPGRYLLRHLRLAPGAAA